jgi:uncharacterized phiE125 gp8 family phage protein
MTTNWTIRRTSSPQSLAVSLDEAKAHLRVAGSDQDGLILLLIESATEKLERDIERCFVQATWEQSQCSFPADGGQIKLNMGGTISISSVSYVDTDGATQTLDPAEYSLDIGRNGVTCLNDDSGWPETLTTISGRDVVTISFTCGIADGDCLPRLFKHGILLETARAYFDPAQESSIATDNGRSYEAIVRGLIRSSYP